ncbi:MAG: hypothetical protein K6U00_05905 [Armatimonadetes bacterium]|nr:hypothetical protein [Armatimonadota bacterium]
MAGSGPLLWGEKGPPEEEIQQFAYKSRRRPRKRPEEHVIEEEHMPGAIESGGVEEASTEEAR